MDMLSTRLPSQVFAVLTLTVAMGFGSIAQALTGTERGELVTALQRVGIAAKVEDDMMILAEAVGLKGSTGTVDGLVISVEKELTDRERTVVRTTVSEYLRKRGILRYRIVGVIARQGDGKLRVVVLE